MIGTWTWEVGVHFKRETTPSSQDSPPARPCTSRIENKTIPSSIFIDPNPSASRPWIPLGHDSVRRQPKQTPRALITKHHGWWFNQSFGAVLSARAEICSKSGSWVPELLACCPQRRVVDFTRPTAEVRSGTTWESGSFAVTSPSRAKDRPPDPRVIALRLVMREARHREDVSLNTRRWDHVKMDSGWATVH